MALRLNAEIGLDGAGFERGLRRVGSVAASNLKNFVVGAFGIYGIQAAIRKTVDTASDLVDESQRLTMTVEQLQLLRQAAKDGGTEMGALASAFERLNVARAKALSGDKGALAAFAKLGIGRDALKNQTTASLFMGPIRSTVQGGNVEALAKPLRDIFGRGFGELIPVLSSDFEELETKMRRLGVFMDTKTAVQLDFLGDNLSLASQIIVVQLAPAILKFVEVLLMAIGRLKSIASFFGASTSKMSTRDMFTFVLANLTGDTKTLKDLLDKGKPDFKSGLNAMRETESEWKGMLDEMKRKLAEQAAKLGKPAPPVFQEEVAEEKKKRIEKDQPDALVRVGNFLGASQSAIVGIAERQLQVQAQTLAATRQIVENTRQGVARSGWGEANFKA